MMDSNTDVTNRRVEFDWWDEFCYLFNLTNLINSPTCCTKTHKSTIDLILTNKEVCFQKTKVTETGLSDFQRLIKWFLSDLHSKFLRSQFCRLEPKKSTIEILKILMRRISLKKLKTQTSYSIQMIQMKTTN